MDALFYAGSILFVLGVGALIMWGVAKAIIREAENDFTKKINIERNEIAALEKERRWLEGMVK